MSDAIARAALQKAKDNETQMEKFTLSSNHIFADAAARDLYFSGNPNELVEGQFISVGSGFQLYESLVWKDVSAVLKGEKGDAGPTGEQGPQGEQGPVGNDGLSGIIANQNGGSNLAIWVGTQAEYDTIGSPDINTLYIISSE